jgi:DNA-binding LacI/PurR family transcriptional regulator
VPTIRKLAGDYEVSVNTALAALRVLEEQGWIQRKPSGSAFVSPQHGRVSDRETRTTSSTEIPHIALIGSCSSDPADGWGTRIIAATEAALAQNGSYALTRMPSFEESEKELRRMLRQVDALGRRLGGAVIYFSWPEHLAAMTEKLDRLGLPWVTLYRPSEQIAHNFVSADNLSSGKAVGRCFILENIERIVILSPDLAPVVTWTQKVTGLLEAFLHHNRPIRGIEYIRCAGKDEPDGYAALRDYLAHQPAPQAVFATGDYLAVGAMRACRECGLAIPDDIAVVGSTGLDIARFTTPSMTVAAQPMEAVGRGLAQMLLRMIQTGERRLPGQQLNGGLLLRDSMKISGRTRQILAEEGLLHRNAGEDLPAEHAPWLVNALEQS